jgi:GTP cyclohydrolase I
MELNTEKIGRLVRELLSEIGEDPAREGLLDTPKRVAKAEVAQQNRTGR